MFNIIHNLYQQDVKDTNLHSYLSKMIMNKIQWDEMDFWGKLGVWDELGV